MLLQGRQQWLNRSKIMGTGEKVRGHLERIRMAMTVLEEVGK